jgi:putative phosphoesterase
MKLGLLGDIHGNALALEAVLASVSELGVDRLLITGDLVGYYFQPEKVLDLLSKWNHIIVRGNHEDMLASIRMDSTSLPKIEAKYGIGLRLALEQLSTTQLDTLTNLPMTKYIEIDRCNLLLCHGSPWDTDKYIYPDASEEIIEKCASVDADIVIMGHTHYPMSREIDSTLLVNPGSVGQPRNKRPGAAWAILDTEKKDVTFRNENYNIQSVVNEAVRRQPNLPYLAEVLVRT